MPNTTEWITIAAILVGPVLALLTQRLLDYLREQKERRVRLFLSLMSTRATPISPEHINALNSIDVVFWRDQEVREVWQRLLTHIATDASKQGWQDRYNDLKVDLLREIGAKVGYNFSVDYFKRQIYYPKAFGDLEADNMRLRAALSKALTEDGLKVRVLSDSDLKSQPAHDGQPKTPRD